MKENKKERPNCYDCKYRGSVPGSAHSSCNHPKCKQGSDSILGLMSALSGGHAPQIKTGLKVVGSPQGIRGGWFNHPFNFDPVWLESCNGFEKK